MDTLLGSFATSFRRMSSSPRVSSVLLTSSSMSSSRSTLVLLVLSVAVLLGQVTGDPKSYDYNGFDDGSYDPFYGQNVVKIKKVVDYYSKPQYAFGYEVDDYYNQLSHGRWEIRDGDVTQGQYRVLLPDGRIQIVSYIADKFGYRPTVEYIGKGVHPPPPPAYAKVKIPKILEVAAVPAPLAIAQPVASPYPFLAPAEDPYSRIKAPQRLAYDLDPVKIKVNSLPVNGPLPVVDPYSLGYGYGLDPAFAGSNTINKISRKRALLYDRTLFRKDVEKRAASKRKASVVNNSNNNSKNSE